MKKIMVLLIAAILLTLVLAGCTQQSQQTTTPTATSAPVPSPEPTPTAPPVAPEAPQPPSVTLGEGEQAISEDEIPPYDDATDKELEELIKEVEG